ncbi:DUF1659 domain-containing protein [Crassaminicella thermophila]|uniref:DUF1659 domain-containing protein n=1 Tax=Crassaminicella thermophila TaxID=2599308 RepID=A0A5C0SC69_CRATE|nr:DUF1659 domain-containing protein [Crassaminicella thermophila]QEK11522.1 DUF1659 domain-containing protein [Crassaminicella thermophila]
MAVNVNAGPSKLKIIFSNGVDENGKERKKTKTYSNLKSTSTDQDVYDLAAILVGLQTDTALKVSRLDEKEISQG